MGWTWGVCGTLSMVPSALRSSTPSLAGSGLPVATQLMMGSEPRLNSSSEASLMIWGKRSGVEKSVLGLVVLCPMYRRCSDLSPVTSAVEPVLGSGLHPRSRPMLQAQRHSQHS